MEKENNKDYQKLNLTIHLKDLVKESTINCFKDKLEKILKENDIITTEYNNSIVLNSITLYNNHDTLVEYTQL